ncbi:MULTISPECIES: translation initiation factor IF-2 [Myxococcus]|uniref:translation initiation factor IF-2 n=1 Tax=Myxococcus TaxID=32 RepID=UPI001129E01B|nr:MULTISPECIES: translation initiation factor IF-2 [Myxococcus]QDE81828.1 translation initiation factor IF-2 [Myxococcus xanthus]WAM28478.1 translation initiation factor IF-2 [Myxococcus sp. NMCA1]
MSKKRVHEIAKELKSHGIELDNKEVVTELSSLGYDVKSHSSSLDDDQATAAVQKILDKRKPKQATPPVTAKGFVVRRKVGPPAGATADSGAEASQAAEPAYEPPSAPEPATFAAEEPVHAPPPVEAPRAPVEAPSAPEPQRVEAPVAAAAEPSAPTAVTSTPPAQVAEAPKAPAAAEVASPPPAAEAPQAPVEAPRAAVQAPAAAQPRPSVQESTTLPQPPPRSPVPPAVRTSSSTPSSATVVSRGPAPGYQQRGGPGGGRPGGPGGPGGRPGGPGGPGGRPGGPGGPGGRPGGPGGPGGRPGGPGGRPSYQGPGSYQGAGRPGQGPVRPTSAPGTGVQASASASPTPQGPTIMVGGVPHAQVSPTGTARPTATQAVVISRPLIQVRRVTPTAGQAKQYPMAPGRTGIPERREYKVVPDHLGRGRELVDVSKNKERGQRKRTSGDTQSVSKQELTDMVWGRVTIPIRGKKRKPTKKGAKTQITQMAEEKKVIKLQEGISVSDLGQRMGVRSAELIKKLMGLGKMATANQLVDADTAEMIAGDYGWKIDRVGFEVEDYLPEVEARPEDERPRPPVVAIMGHVDHGKTSLLDAIRKASVAQGEAGGITQHIGAYSISTARGDVTFLDTPGHEAFTSMRARGADVTDIVVLVVASDDGVMPQTVEAIKHAKAAEVPIVVAINKMDLPAANLDRVKKDLATHELVPEEWGGDTIMVPVSAKTKENLELLLENLALQAEVLELTSNPSRPSVGAIIEAKLDRGRGPVATVLVQEGTLKLGDAVVTGSHYGRVRAMTNSRGEQVKEVKPGYCAEVVGLSGVPGAGDAINVVADEKAAKQIAEHRNMKERQTELSKVSRESLEQLFAKTKAGGGPKELRVVIKADVQGSAEAVRQAVQKLSTHKVKVEVVHSGVGAITEGDVMRAAASKGVVLGFNVNPESGAEAAAKAQEVVLKSYSIIYELIDGVRTEMEGLLEPIRTERKLGRAEVRNTFNVPRLGTIAGAAVLDGVMKRGAFVRLMRENKQLFSGKMASLRRFKDDVKEVAQGFECGIGIESFNDLKPGDIIEAYEIEETRQSLT